MLSTPLRNAKGFFFGLEIADNNAFIGFVSFF